MEERQGKEVYFGKEQVSTYGNRVPGLHRPMKHVVNRGDLVDLETADTRQARRY